MNSFLMWVGGLLAVILAALFAVPSFVDWNGYRGVFEEEASRILGRSVRVGGDVNLRLLPSPYVRFEMLSIADSSGLTGEPFFKADSFTMWLAVPPLLSGILEAEKIELERPVVRLAAKTDGDSNWAGFSIRSGSLPFVPSGVSLQSVHIVDGVLSLDVEGGGRLGQVEGINGEFMAESLSGPFTFSGSVNSNDLKFNVKAATTHTDGRGGMQLKIVANEFGTKNTYKFDGQINGLDGKPQASGRVSASVVALQTGQKGEADLEVSSQISADTRGAELRDITAAFESVGQPQTIIGDGRVTWGARHLVEVKLTSQWLDLDHFATADVQPVSNGSKGASATKTANQLSDKDKPVGQGGKEAVFKLGERLSSASNPSESAAVVSGAPWQVSQGLLNGIASRLPSDSDIKAQFQVDQANLGGESVSDLRLVLSRDGGPLNIETLRARLPGSGRLEFSGVLSSHEAKQGLSGQMFVGGASLAKIKSWAFGEGANDGAIKDGPFSISGDLMLREASLSLKNARAEFSGIPVRGGISWTGGGQDGRLSVDLEAYELDGRWFGLKPVALSTLMDSLGAGASVLQDSLIGLSDGREKSKSEENSKGVVAGSKGAGVKEISIRLKTGKLHNGGYVFHNVDAQLLMKDKTLSIPAVSFATSEGLSVNLEGEIQSIDAQPRGELRWVASAKNARAAKPLRALFDAGDSGASGVADFLASSAPFHLAGKIDLGSRQKGAADLDIDGKVRGGRLMGQLRFDGGLSHWGGQPADITLRLESPRSRAVLDLLAPGEGIGADITSTDLPMRGVFKAVGIPFKGMKAMGLARSQQLTLIYNGSVQVGDAKDSNATLKDGEIVVSALHARDVLSLMGLPVGEGMEAARLDGLVDLKREGDSFVFRPRDLKFGDSTLAGRIKVFSHSEGGRMVDADLVIDKAQLPALMSALLVRPSGEETDASGLLAQGESLTGSGKPSDASKKGRKGKGTRSKTAGKKAKIPKPALTAGVRRIEHLFSNSQFDLSVLSRLRGRVGMRVGSLVIAPGLEIVDAKMESVLKGDKIEVSLVQGKAIGGTATGKITLDKGRAGVALAGEFAIEGASLSKFTRWDETGTAIAMATGGGSMKIEFSGRALSPRALISVLSGSGEIVISDATVKGLAPEIISLSADEVMARSANAGNEALGGGERPRTPERGVVGGGGDLERALKERLGVGEVELGSRSIGIEIVDGAARLTPFSMKNQHGVTTGLITIDIGQMAVDGVFKMSARAKEDKQAWPPVTVAFVGPLGKVGSVAPLLSVTALERELTVRKLEQNVSELERLRRLDEEAAKRRQEREEERLREQEAARALAAEEAEAQTVPDVIDGDGAQQGASDPGVLQNRQPVPGADGDVIAPDTTVAEELPEAEKPENRVRRIRARKRPPRPSPTAGELMRQQF